MLRAREINASALLKATKVDGVYDADPVTHPKAKLFKTLKAREALDRNLRVMDMTALTMAIEGDLPILIFNLRKRGNIKKVVMGATIGTRVT